MLYNNTHNVKGFQTLKPSLIQYTAMIYCLLFIPTNAQTYILKYFINTPICFSASAPSSESLNFVLARVTNYYNY